MPNPQQVNLANLFNWLRQRGTTSAGGQGQNPFAYLSPQQRAPVPPSPYPGVPANGGGAPAASLGGGGASPAPPSGKGPGVQQAAGGQWVANPIGGRFWLPAGMDFNTGADLAAKGDPRVAGPTSPQDAGGGPNTQRDQRPPVTTPGAPRSVPVSKPIVSTAPSITPPTAGVGGGGTLGPGLTETIYGGPNGEVSYGTPIPGSAPRPVGPGIPPTPSAPDTLPTAPASPPNTAASVPPDLLNQIRQKIQRLGGTGGGSAARGNSGTMAIGPTNTGYYGQQLP